jgi:deoxyribodipyrimidine photo-lyase
MHACLLSLDSALRQHGSSLISCHGLPQDEIPALAARLNADAVYAARDYEPEAIQRDMQVMQRLNCANKTAPRELRLVKDQVIFECRELMTQGGTPFSVFTPYKNAWLKCLDAQGLPSFGARALLGHLALHAAAPLHTLAQIGFGEAGSSGIPLPAGMEGAAQLLQEFAPRLTHYKDRRDFPAAQGPSYLSAHLRFGTLSIRHLVHLARTDVSAGAQTWLSELVWREFYQMILWHHPHVSSHSFKPAFDALQWDDAPDLLAAWREGRTGYPLVDAAMRQLNATGYMHNRLRMVAASFLTKDLGLDWRQGARCFADQLIDHDLAANNGGWQWAASTGCDAQPWFRIFNPVTQSKNFDGKGNFIRRHVPELATVPDEFIHTPWQMDLEAQRACGVQIGVDYPAPVVDHATARARTLGRFAAAKALAAS